MLLYLYTHIPWTHGCGFSIQSIFQRELSIIYAFFFYVVTCRVEGLSYKEPSLFSDCNSGCLCSIREWDPVCGENGITYVSPCLAGCASSTGSGRNTVRHTSLTSWHTHISQSNRWLTNINLTKNKTTIFGLNCCVSFIYAIVFAAPQYQMSNTDISVVFSRLFTYRQSVSCCAHILSMNLVFFFVRCLTIAGV